MVGGICFNYGGCSIDQINVIEFVYSGVCCCIVGIGYNIWLIGCEVQYIVEC